MKIGFDVDGVLADFSSGYQEVLKKVSGRDLFLPGDAADAPCWDWDKFRGYTSKERLAAWNYIRTTPEFNLNLAPLEGAGTLKLLIRALERKHAVYFITSRVGDRPKRWTEIWLTAHLDYRTDVAPTVLIAEQRSKGLFAKALGLDVYVDDNFDNVHDVVALQPECRTYLRSRSYNRQSMVGEPGAYQLVEYPPVNPLIVRIDRLGEMFDAELSNL